MGSIVGSKLANTWAVGHRPGQPSGFAAATPAPVGLMLPLALFLGYVPAANTNLPRVLADVPICWTSALRCAVAAAPTALSVLTSGPYASEVPAPDSNIRLFIGCFEYS